MDTLLKGSKRRSRSMVEWGQAAGGELVDGVLERTRHLKMYQIEVDRRLSDGFYLEQMKCVTYFNYIIDIVWLMCENACSCSIIDLRFHGRSFLN